MTLSVQCDQAAPPPPPLKGAPLSRSRRAWQDICRGLRFWRLGVALGWLDIRLQYRGSTLGVFWLTISTAFMVGGMGFIYSSLFKMDLHVYLPFLALSIVLWQNGVALVAGDACTCFTSAQETICSTSLPVSLQCIRTLCRSLIILGCNLPVPFVVFCIFGIWPVAATLLCLPALLLWLINGFAACLVLGSFCARFRDIPPIIGSIMQILFYITPVIWMPSQLGESGWWLPYNPFDSLFEIMRQPLLGQVPSGLCWSVALVFTLLMSLLAWVVFRFSRPRLAFWI